MQESIVPIIVALIALGGTVAGLVVGYRKWSEERGAERAKAFQTHRQGVYQELWQRVEQLNVDGRLMEIPQEEFSRRTAEINAFMMTSNVYIDDADRSLVNAYLQAARAFHQASRASDDEAVKRALGDTQEIPEEALRQAEGLAEAHKKALELRESVLQKARAVVSGAA